MAMAQKRYAVQENQDLVMSFVRIHARNSKIEKDKLELLKDLNIALNGFFNPTTKEVKRTINQASFNESCDIIIYIMNYLRYIIGISANTSRIENYINMIDKIEHKLRKIWSSSICLGAQLTNERILTIDSYCAHLRIKAECRDQVRYLV